MRLDSSLIPLEKSCFQEDDEIVGITIDMIQMDVSWHNNQSAQTIRNLENLQSHLFNQRIERSKYYGNLMKHTLNQREGQEKFKVRKTGKEWCKWNNIMSCHKDNPSKTQQGEP